jgi:hypothetical protein
MNLVVNHAREKPLAPGINHSGGRYGLQVRTDSLDALTADQNICVTHLPFIYQSGIYDQGGVHRPKDKPTGSRAFTP